MKVLVTGGSGFIGHSLVAHLSLKHDVLAPSRAELDLTDGGAVRIYLNHNSVDAVIHGAVKPGHRNASDVSGQLLANMRMFFNLANNQDRFSRLIFLSSGLVYGQAHYLPRMAEGYLGAHIPADEGGLSKYIISRSIEKSENMTELRPFGVFGPREDYAIRFISNAICKTLFDLPITIKQNRKFDYLYVKDLDRITEHFLSNSGKYRAYNLTCGNSYELLDLARIVLAISGKDLPIRVANGGMGQEYSGDNSRLKDELPGFEFTPIQVAIQELYDWYSLNRHTLKKELLLTDK